MTPISDTVQAALYYVTHYHLNSDQYYNAEEEMLRQITEMDRNRDFPPMTAAARILAAEVERLRGELNTN
jgi:hypothetical protein